MGNYVIKMPDIGEGIAEVELVSWNVAVGDTVTEDQALADVMTDKATVEIPSPVNGTVIALGGNPGDIMAVGSVLIRLQVEGAGNAHANEAASPQPEPSPKIVQQPACAERPVPAPVERENSAAPSPAQSPVAAQKIPLKEGERSLASPAVRKRAWDLGIELRFVQGTGPTGQILHEDLEAYANQALLGQVPVANSMYSARTDEVEIPVIGLRRKIAQRMQDTKRRIPHFTYVEEIDVNALEELRVHLNSIHGNTRGKLTLLPFIARAIVVALRDYPQINARYDDEANIVTRSGATHLGIATQSDAGLMVPVVRHAEALDIWGFAKEVSRLADAARKGKVLREELSGSTITITSLGALGGITTTPVINSPEVAIVGVNRIVQKPVVINGNIVVRKTMNLSSSFDHRVVDGMDAAQFIQAVRGLLEQPVTLFLE